MLHTWAALELLQQWDFTFWALILWYHITGWKNFWRHCHLIGPKLTVWTILISCLAFVPGSSRRFLAEMTFVFCVYPALVLVEVLEVVALQSLLYLGVLALICSRAPWRFSHCTEINIWPERIVTFSPLTGSWDPQNTMGLSLHML